MVIAVSACLLGENCKYNGGNNYSSKLETFLKDHRVIPICPEVLGGLPVPRDPAEIVDGVVKTKAGKSVDAEFRRGAELARAIVIENNAEMVILQSRSPSCGVKSIYDGTFSGITIPGKGVFAQMMSDCGVKVVDIEDI